MPSRRHVVLLIAALIASGCGYVHSGSWDDVPENWYRAFHVYAGFDKSPYGSEYPGELIFVARKAL